jgi:hypothetical protein
MQYKLIKDFPASPELGTIVTKQKNGHYLYVNDLNDASLFWDREIENYPEFWEEVKEKEYTILSFVNSSKDLFNIDENGSYRYKTWSKNVTSLSLKDMLAFNNKIHSVRRKHDQQTFEIGEQIKALSTDTKNVTLKIEKIELIGSAIHLWGNNYSISLMCAEKAPIRKPILITEDGVEMFGDINYNLFSVLPSDNFREARTYLEFARNEKNGKWLHFHTKEAREEYIKWNKPMYSLNDVSRSGASAESKVGVIEELEKLGRK